VKVTLYHHLMEGFPFVKEAFGLSFKILCAS